MVATSLGVGVLLNVFCPIAAGSGIPQLKLAFWKDFGTVPWRVAWVKFIAGILSIGGGCSLGREGPSVQLAGAVASNLAGLAGEAKQNRRAAAAAGASAGLAAAFNAPLAATTFVLEEIIGDLNSRLLGSVLLASVLGALCVHGIIGAQPAFTLTGADTPSWMGYALTPLVAALASLAGVYFQRASLGLRRRAKEVTRAPAWLLPVGGALITWAGRGDFLEDGAVGGLRPWIRGSFRCLEGPHGRGTLPCCCWRPNSRDLLLLRPRGMRGDFFAVPVFRRDGGGGGGGTGWPGVADGAGRT